MSQSTRKNLYLHRMLENPTISDSDKESLISDFTPEVIDKLLSIQDETHRSLLHIASKHLKTLAFQALITKASPAAIDQALPLQSNDGWTALQASARYQDSASFQALIAKASPDAIDQALPLQSYNGWTALQMSARYQDSASFQALIGKASPDALNKALLLQDDQGQTALQTSARYQDSASFQALIGKASPDALNKALPLQNNQGWSTLQVTARYQDSASFQALIVKASPATIDQALPLQNEQGRTALQTNAHYQDSASFQALIAKASPGVILNVLGEDLPAAKKFLDLVIQKKDKKEAQKIIVIIGLFYLAQNKITLGMFYLKSEFSMPGEDQESNVKAIQTFLRNREQFLSIKNDILFDIILMLPEKFQVEFLLNSLTENTELNWKFKSASHQTLLHFIGKEKGLKDIEKQLEKIDQTIYHQWKKDSQMSSHDKNLNL